MTTNLRITNIVCTGRLPFKVDFQKIMENSKSDWQVVNEDMCPILQRRFLRGGINNLNVHKKRKGICVSIWCSGAINIVGALSLEEAQKCYDKVISEIKSMEA